MPVVSALPDPTTPVQPGRVQTATPKPPALAGVKARRGRIVVSVTCSCRASAVARKRGKVVARGKGTGKVVLKLSKRVRGKVTLTVNVGSVKLKRTVKLR